ncbi:MAG: ribonuclease HI [Oceanicoccus sp.]|jgi:ribonuclease HI
MDVNLYTDGSCLGNPGPGGWAFLIEVGKKSYRGSDGAPHSTNNRMELQAVIEGIKEIELLKLKGEITVFSDSSWVVKTMTDNWKRKKNLDLWEELMPLLPGKTVNWQWVRGHSGHRQNEDCDVRALKAAHDYKRIARTMDPRDLRLPGDVPALF